MADIAMCENEYCERSLECFRFTAEINPYRQTYLTEMKERCEGDRYKYWIPNFKGVRKGDRVPT